MISRTASPFPMPSPGASRLRRALQFAMPYRQEIGIICFLTLIAAGINAIEPLLLKAIFDHLTTNAAMKTVLTNVGLLFALSVGRETNVALCNWLTWRSRLGIHYSLLESTVGRLHRMPLSMQRSEGVGAILTRLDRGIQGFVGAVTQLVFNVFPAVFYLVISVVIMLRLEWRMALLVILFAPIPVLISAWAAPEQARRERSLLDRWSKIYSRFNEVLSGIVTVRSFTMEDMEKQRFLRDVNEANQVVIRGVGLDSGFGAASNMVIALARVAVIVLGAILVVRGQTSVGTLIAMLGYVGGLFGPVQGLSGVYQTVQRASASLDEIFAILDVHEHLGDSPNATEVTDVRGDVVFDRVEFRYESAGRPLLNGVSLSVSAGETIAIVGPSGSGKTTMMALLMRFYDPIVGRITLDGRDLRDLKQSSVRRNIGVVLQDPLLFNDTIRNNIAYGRPEAGLPEVEAAARAANAHDFVARLPERYETMVGERGSRLSVGERQRLTIARALIKNPRIIILDEATSSLDAESEGLVQDALEQLMRGRTTFVIAHRLSTVVNADKIVVLKDGRVDEIGNHRELVKRGGYYSTLVARQTRGLIVNEGEEP
ncbi:MAG TPA: ABC transporter ATP-binding protein [Opitutaceae bacterium]|nr:ABC transporter ATP-binding protein [Opitutaceae bacterium]